jgi:gliding motility-associated-like protein
MSTYRDEGLINGREYCYKVQSSGSYGVADINSPLLNFSQEACEVPIDNVAPCPPTLEVDDICDELVNCTDEDNIFNTLIWTNPIDICEDTDDVVGYNVYYSPIEGAEFDLIASFDDSNTLNFEHKPERGIAGCYAVSAIDTFFNESVLSNIVCIDNCPSYELPNTFTPNGDGFNDVFKPFPYCFVDQVSFRVFNRWGQLVWETNDPDLNWDGTNLGGNELPSGVYYYTCQIFEQRVNGSIPRPDLLSGYIELLKGD